jgi:RNA polymerase sigma-70 factor (ECF subfamily)
LETKTNIFLSLIELNKGIIYKVSNTYCRDAEDRKDLVQEIVFQLWRSFSNYNEQFKYSTWVYRIALNVAISFYRKETKRKDISMPLIDGIFDFVDLPINTETQAQLTFLQQFILELKELDKALMLLYLEEKTYKEIAEIIGITETNVATKISRIKEKLKQKFSQIQR